MTNYPKRIDDGKSLPVAIDLVTPVQGAVFNRLRDSILAVETELGTTPSGIYGTVANRLGTIESVVGNLQIISLTQDLGGTLAAPQVIGIRGRPISSTPPEVGNVLVWSGLVWEPLDVISHSIFFANGDLSGNGYSQTVVGLRGNPVSNATPTLNQLLTWTGAQWAAADPPVSFSAGGDLSGTNSNQTVIGLRGVSVSSTAPTDGYVLEYHSGTLSWSPTALSSSLPPSGTASGDLSGSYPSPTVAKIDGYTVPAGGSTGNALQISGAGTLSYNPINLAGGTNCVTGVLPIANMSTPSAITTTASFTQPIVGLSVVVSISSTTNFATNQQCYVTDASGYGGLYQVQSVGVGTMTLVNTDLASNTAAGTTIASGAAIVSAGIGNIRCRTIDFTAFTGANSNIVYPSDTAYTLTLPDGTAIITNKLNTVNETSNTFTGFTQPNIGGTVTVTVATMGIDSTFTAGFYVYWSGTVSSIAYHGFWKVTMINSTTSITLQNMGAAANGNGVVAPPGTAIPSATLYCYACIVNGTGLVFMPNHTGNWFATTATEPSLSFSLSNWTNGNYDGTKRTLLWAHFTFPGSVVPAANYEIAEFGAVGSVTTSNPTGYAIKKGWINGNVWYTSSDYNSINLGQLSLTTHYTTDAVGALVLPSGFFGNSGEAYSGPWDNTTGWPTPTRFNYIGHLMHVNVSAANVQIIAYESLPASGHVFRIGAQRNGGTPGLLCVIPQARVDISTA